MSETRLFIGDVKTCSKEDLERAFAPFGELKEVWVARDPAGFAFVEYFDKEAALNALHAMNNKLVSSDTIRVEISKVKKTSRGDNPRSAPYPRRGSGRGGPRGYGPPLSRYSHGGDSRGYPPKVGPYSAPYYGSESRYYDDRGAPIHHGMGYHHAPLRSGPPPPHSYHRYPPMDRHEYDEYYYGYPPPPASRRYPPPPGPPHHARDNGSSLYAPHPSPSPYSRGARYDPYPHPHYPESDRYGPLDGLEPYPSLRTAGRAPKPAAPYYKDIDRGRPPSYSHPVEKSVPRARERPILNKDGGEISSNNNSGAYRNGYEILAHADSADILEHGSTRRRTISSSQQRVSREFPPDHQYSPREYDKEYLQSPRVLQASYPPPHHRPSPHHY